MKHIKNSLYRLKQAPFDARAAIELAKLGAGYLPWTESALAPSALMQIINDIIVNRRRTAVEFGAGISTIYIGLILKRFGGHLYSFEHDPEWAEVVEVLAKENDVEDNITLTVAPLTSIRLPYATSDWYDPKLIREIVEDLIVDLVVVDGPPAYTKETALARYPALPMIQSRLSASCAVFLDDIRRDGEKQILGRWQTMSDIKFVPYPACGGIARGTRGPSFNAI